MKKPWHDRTRKDYGSDANALRRLAEEIQREDGYNDQVLRLMFRCADAIEDGEAQLMRAERLAEEVNRLRKIQDGTARRER